MNRFSHYQANIKPSTLFMANRSPNAIHLLPYEFMNRDCRDEKKRMAKDLNEPSG